MLLRVIVTRMVETDVGLQLRNSKFLKSGSSSSSILLKVFCNICYSRTSLGSSCCQRLSQQHASMIVNSNNLNFFGHFQNSSVSVHQVLYLFYELMPFFYKKIWFSAATACKKFIEIWNIFFLMMYLFSIRI